MRRDERVSVPEQAVDSPYDRPTAPSGIPMAPPPRQAEPDHDGAVPPGPREPDSREAGRAAPPAFASPAPGDSGTSTPADLGIAAPPDSRKPAKDDSGGAAPADMGTAAPPDSRKPDKDHAEGAAPAVMGIVAPPDLKRAPDGSEGTTAPDSDKAAPPDSETAVDDSRRTDPPEEVFGGEDAERFRGRLRELQGDFVDDPERAVRGAEELVGEVLSALNEHKRALDETWHGGDTERLRVALRRYRSFLDRLVDA